MYNWFLKRCKRMEVKTSCASGSHQCWLESLQTIPPSFGQIPWRDLSLVSLKFSAWNPFKNLQDCLEGFESTSVFDNFLCFLLLAPRITFETHHPCELKDFNHHIVSLFLVQNEVQFQLLQNNQKYANNNWQWKLTLRLSA